MTDDFRPEDPLNSYPETLKAALGGPKTFFGRLPVAGGLQAPLGFAAANLLIGGLGILLFGGGVKGMLGFFLWALIVGLAVGAALVLLVARELFGGTGDYEATFRGLAYATPPALLIGVPVLQFLAALYWAYLAILGIARAQETDLPHAVLTLLVAKIAGAAVVYGLGLWGLALRVNPLV